MAHRASVRSNQAIKPTLKLARTVMWRLLWRTGAGESHPRAPSAAAAYSCCCRRCQHCRGAVGLCPALYLAPWSTMFSLERANGGCVARARAAGAAGIARGSERLGRRDWGGVDAPDATKPVESFCRAVARPTPCWQPDRSAAVHLGSKFYALAPQNQLLESLTA